MALFTEMARTANRAVKRIDDCIEAPDPWHAVLYLQKEVQAYGLLEPSRSPGAPLFRGQANVKWPIVSSLRRQKTPKKMADAKHLLELYCRCLQAFEIEETPAVVKPDSHIATAQHYGMLPTPYLDFTVDPLIAVYFACLKADENEPVVVYQMHFNHAHSLGARVLVPPPWVRRLRRQKGLFLHSETDEDLRNYCRKIVFPAAADYTAWLDGREQVLPETKWFSDLSRWITGAGKRQLNAHLSPDDVRAHVVDSCGKPPFLYDSLRPGPMAQWHLFLEEMTEWLALRASGPDSIHWDCIPVIHLVHNNPGWYRTFKSAMKLLPSLVGEFLPSGQSPNQHLLELWHQIERCLQENDARRSVWDVKGLVPRIADSINAADRNILNRIEAYVAPQRPPHQGSDPYEARIRSRERVPPTLVDTFVCDLWQLIQRLGLGDQGPRSVDEHVIGAALEIYMMRDWANIPGYRPWTHWHFVRSLSRQERTQLASEAATYMRADGTLEC